MTANHQAQHIVPDAVFEQFAPRIADWTNGEFKLNGGYNLIELPDNTNYGDSYRNYRLLSQTVSGNNKTG